MAIDDLTALHWGHLPDCQAQVDKHFIGYHTLQLMTRGRILLAYGDDQQVCEGCWIWPAHPGPRIRFRCVDQAASWHHRYVACTGPRIQSWLAAGLWPRRPQSVVDPPALTARFDAVLANLESGAYWDRLRATSELEHLLIDLAAARQAERQEPWLATALAELDRCPDLRPDCSAIAQRCGLGPVAFLRRFKRQMGLTPVAYCREQRIARAKEVLATSDDDLAAIAERLGYADQYYFSRHFKQAVGLAPGAFRRSLH